MVNVRIALLTGLVVTAHGGDRRECDRRQRGVAHPARAHDPPPARGGTPRASTRPAASAGWHTPREHGNSALNPPAG